MMRTNTLVASLISLLAAACSADQTSPPSTTPVATKKPTAGAAFVHGDLAPKQLVPVPIPAPTETALLHGSDAMAIGKPFVLETPAEPVVGRDYRRLVTGHDPAGLTLPIDTPSGALVLVRSIDGSPLSSVHMHSVATGRRLDHARDAQNTQQVSRAGSPLRESGFTPLLDSRQLSFDEPMAPGLVQIDLPPNVATAGVVIEVQQPSTPIALTAVPSELAYTNGDSAALSFSLASSGVPLDGANVGAWIEFPDHTRSAPLSVSASGGGGYVAQMAMGGIDHIGTWGVHVTATGTANGVAFERSVETAFAYTPSHAQMTDLGTPTTVRGADGLIDEVSVDVGIQTLEDDRFSVRGTLTYTDSNGVEHALANAQTGQTVSAGTATVTLHFTADSLALANVDGPFHVRDVALVSQGFGITQHRIGRGLDLSTDPMKAVEIRYPAVISIQAQDLIDNGDLPPRRL